MTNNLGEVNSADMQERLENLFHDLDGPTSMTFYRQGRKYARAMTTAHSAASVADADTGAFFLSAADALLAPLGGAGADDLRDFIAGAVREDENRATYLFDNPDGSEPSTASFGPEATASTLAFQAIGRIIALIGHPARRTDPSTVTRLIVDQVEAVAYLMTKLPSNYELAMLQGMSGSWHGLDHRSV